MALDLTKDLPRSPFDELDGYVWLPRMIDKARAFAAGTHGDYTAYPCPGDKRFLGHFGVDPAAFFAEVKAGRSDEELVAWVTQHAKTATAEHKAALRRSYFTPPSNIGMRMAVWVYRKKYQGAILAKTPDIQLEALDTFPKITAAEEGHAIPSA